MTDDRSLERAARSWIEAGPIRAPDRVIDAALLRIETTTQERDLRIPWRLPSMITPVRVAAAAVIGVLAIGGAIYLGSSGQSSVAGPGPSHTPTPSASPSASASHAATNYASLPGWIVFEYAGKAPDGTTPASVDYPNSIWLAHADGTAVGGRGLPAAFGFYANKQLTTGEGGMLPLGSDAH